MDRDYDFYSPFFSAAIVTSDGVRVPLWTNVAGGVATEAAKAFSTPENKLVHNGLVSFPFLESLTIEMGLGYFARMSAVLTPPFQDARKFLDSTLVENGKATLEAVIGYSAGTTSGPVLSAPFQALILEPDISIGMDSTVTLNAFGVAGYDASVTQASRSFSNRTRRAILEFMAGGEGAESITDPKPELPPLKTATVPRFGVVFEIPPEVKVNTGPKQQTVRRNLYIDFSEIVPGSDADSALNREVTVAQGWKTDWMFMLQIAQEAGCWITMGVRKENEKETNYVKVIAIETHLAEAPKYNLRLFDYVQGRLGPGYQTNNGTPGQEFAEGDFPILGVSTQSKQVWLPGSTKALVAHGVDSRTGDTVNHVWTDANAGPTKATGGGGALPKPDGNNSAVDSKGRGGAPAPGADVNKPTTVEVAKSRFATDFSMGIALRVLTLGIPDIFPGNTVAVRGVGNRFDFNYGVFTVRHLLGPSGFTTELELVSNTSALLATMQKAKAELNEKLGVKGGKDLIATPKEQRENFAPTVLGSAEGYS